MTVNRKTIAGTVVAGLVTALLIWLFQLGGLAAVKDLLLDPAPTIQVRSVDRPDASEFLVGEKLRLALVNAKPEHVLWVFGQGEEMKRLGVAIEWAFKARPDRDGLPEVWRVDAFFLPPGADNYQTTYINLSLQPSQLEAGLFLDQEAVSTGRETVRLTALPEDWRIQGVSIASFSEGEFSHGATLEATPDGAWIAMGASATALLGRALKQARVEPDRYWLEYSIESEYDGAFTYLQRVEELTVTEIREATTEDIGPD